METARDVDFRSMSASIGSVGQEHHRSAQVVLFLSVPPNRRAKGSCPFPASCLCTMGNVCEEFVEISFVYRQTTEKTRIRRRGATGDGDGGPC